MAEHPRHDRASEQGPPDKLQDILRRHVASANATRRGICLLNAGQPEQAIRLFEDALEAGGDGQSLPALMTACLLAMGDTDAAVTQARRSATETKAPSSARTSARIRLAHALYEGGRPDEAIATLREAIQETPDDGELHFQLGTLLAAAGETEEAELRFTQTLSIDRNHSEARVNLALCCGARHAPGEAVGHLQAALRRRPLDARIAMLLAQATAAARQNGRVVDVRATIPQEDWLADREGIEELSRVIEREPDFVDAFIAIPTGEVDRQVF
ncbi:MAG: tetratricopeptide repeat protein, partial [Phycisphaerae bacterium]